MRQNFSPEQIHGHLASNDIAISHERIYQHIGLINEVVMTCGGICAAGIVVVDAIKHIVRVAEDKLLSVSASRRTRLPWKRDVVPSVEVDLVFGKGCRAALLTIVDRSAHHPYHNHNL